MRLVDILSFSFALCPCFATKYLLELTVLKKCGSSATTITNNKVQFSAVCSSGSMRLTVKFAFVLLPFYPNQFRFWGGPPLGGILANPNDISRLLEDVFS